MSVFERLKGLAATALNNQNHLLHTTASDEINKSAVNDAKALGSTTGAVPGGVTLETRIKMRLAEAGLYDPNLGSGHTPSSLD